MTPRSPDRPTLGGRQADIAKAFGKPFMPYQRAIADVAMELDPLSGYLAYSTVIVLVPRQQGKSELLLPVMTHRSLGFDGALTEWIRKLYGFNLRPPGPQRTMYVAQGADQARAKWRDVHLARIQKSPLSGLLIDARLRQNQEMMTWANGSTWFPGSTTSKTGGTGDTLDLGVIDEGWAHDGRTELGMRPTMLTRPWSQLWVASMIPGPERKKSHEWPWLREQIAKGRALVEAGIRSETCYVEFSAPPGTDPGDPRTWRTCMPALDDTIQERAVRADFNRLGLADFEAEYLGWEPQVGTPRWQVVGERVWRGRADNSSRAEDPVALCVASMPDQSSTSIGVASLRDLDRDRVHVELVDRRPGVTWSVDRTVDLCGSFNICSVAIDPSGGAASQIEPLRRALEAANVQVEVLTPNAREVAAASARLVEATGIRGDDPTVEETPRRLFHLSQPELDRSIGSATRKYIGGQWRFAPAIPGADMAPIESVAVALWAGDRVDWEGSSYDIADSLG